MNDRRSRQYARMVVASAMQRFPRDGNRFRIPYRLIQYTGADPLTSTPVVVVPAVNGFLVAPLTNLARAGNSSWIDQVSRVVHSPELLAYLNAYRVGLVQPIHISHSDAGEKLATAEARLNEQTKLNYGSMSGKAFERLVTEVLSDAGLPVIANVRVAQGEIDQSIVLSSEDGLPCAIIVECKNRARSARPVEVSQLHRLFGLQEALRASGLPVDSYLVTSTRLTRSAAKFAKQFAIGHGSIAELSRYLAGAVEARQLVYPVFSKATVDARGEIRLPRNLFEGGPLILSAGRYRGISFCTDADWSNLLMLLRRLTTTEPSEEAGGGPGSDRLPL